MRILTTVLLLLAVVGVAHAELNPREVKSLTEEYVSTETADDRRAEILGELAGVDPMLCQRTLKRSLRDDDERPHALKLAVELRVTGLWKSARRYLDGDDEADVVRLGFAARDKGADADLFKRWEGADPDSASYAFLQDGFAGHPVSLDVIEDFKPYLEGERADDAAAIVAFQLGAQALDVSTDAPALIKQWDELVTAYRLDAKEFRVSGRDVTAAMSASGSVAPIGGNYRLGTDGKLSIDLGDYNEGDFEVVVRVRATEGELQRVGLYSGNGVWLAVHRTDEWSVTMGSLERRVADYNEGEWTEISIRIEDRSDDARKMVRAGWVTIGGTKLVTGGGTNGAMKRFEIDAHGGKLVVGGVEIRH